MSNHKILVFGEMLYDVFPDNTVLGGAAFNLAAHCAKLGNFCTLISAVGSDKPGEKALDIARKLQINTQYVSVVDKHSTGKVLVDVDKNGQPKYKIVQPVAWDYISLLESDYEQIENQQWDCFCFGLLAQRAAVSEKTLHKLLNSLDVKNIYLDVNLRKMFYSKKQIDFSIKCCNILKMNDDEMNVLSDMLFAKPSDLNDFMYKISTQYNVEIVIVTHGEKGASLMYEGKIIQQKAPKVDVNDTVGAGDSFSAAFLNQYLKNNDVSTALYQACELGAKIASQRGAVPFL